MTRKPERGAAWLRIDLAPGVRLGPGKVALLEALAATGSISEAGRRLGMSYRRAWLLIEELNTMFATRAVATRRGGRGGGQATLTPLGAEIVTRYRAMERRVERSIGPDLAALRSQLAKTRSN